MKTVNTPDNPSQAAPAVERLLSVNGRPLRIREPTLSGFELKQRAGLPLEHQLFLKTLEAAKDRPVGDMEALPLMEGMVFYVLAADQLPEDWNIWKARPPVAPADGGWFGTQ